MRSGVAQRGGGGFGGDRVLQRAAADLARRDVALRVGGAQRRREVHVHVHAGVDPHEVRQRAVEEPVVAADDVDERGGEAVAAGVVEVGEASARGRAGATSAPYGYADANGT